ncbi:hypothetical protein AWJ14_09110 [Hoeflea olei]|uniref:Uncharacterized protein n=1 Tax=Hoeflea olei TaxID=1480615 RepID=A0A1C1Z0B6_9HYPH|nr:hypothetical protein AWJ14_09110 [Hoeflea olei]
MAIGRSLSPTGRGIGRHCEAKLSRCLSWVRGFEAPLQCGEYSVEHGATFVDDFVVPEPQHAVAIRCQPCRAAGVPGFIQGVLAAVEFHDQFFTAAAKIADKATDAHLAREPVAVEEAVAELLPKQMFRVGRLGAHAARQCLGRGHRFWGEAPLTRTPRCGARPLPLGER